MEFERSMSALQFDADLASKVVEAHNFMPNVKVGRFVPLLSSTTQLFFCADEERKLFVGTKANLRQIYLL